MLGLLFLICSDSQSSMSSFAEAKQLILLIQYQSERVTARNLNGPVSLAEAFNLMYWLGNLSELSRVHILVHQCRIMPTDYIVIGGGVFVRR